MRIVDLKNGEGNGDDPLLDLLAYSMYLPTREKTLEKLVGFRKDPDVRIFGCEDGGTMSGVIVLRAENNITILNIGVAVAGRRGGLGKSMIRFASEVFPDKALEAETDDDSVGFYRHVGFSITCLGEKYPGVVRYRCLLEPHGS